MQKPRLVNLSQFKDAAEALQAYIASHPQSDDGMYLLAYVFFREDEPKESLQLFTDSAKLKTPTSDHLKIVPRKRHWPLRRCHRNTARLVFHN